MENIPYVEVNATWKKACQHFRDSFRELKLVTLPDLLPKFNRTLSRFGFHSHLSGTPESSNTYIFLSYFNS